MITSFRHDEQKKKKRRRILGVVLLITLLLLSLRGPVANTLGGFFAVIGRPFWSVRDGAVSIYGEFTATISSKITLEAENVHLRGVLDEVALEAYSRQQLREENEDLKAMLKVCGALRDHIRGLLAANLRSWDQGYDDPK